MMPAAMTPSSENRGSLLVRISGGAPIIEADGADVFQQGVIGALAAWWNSVENECN